MSKILTTIVLSTLGAGFTTIASVEPAPLAGFPGFVSRIQGRAPQALPNARVLPVDPTIAYRNKAQKVSGRYIGWNAENPSLLLPASGEGSGEKMDSVVAKFLDGRLLTKQTFEFTKEGKPLKCTNYMSSSDGKNFIYSGHFAYEYDAQGRVISAEKVDVNSTSVRYEYSYTGDVPAYSTQIAYLMDEQGDWTPFQKGEYEFDSNYNTTQEIFSQWGLTGEDDWTLVYKNDATYDELSRLTSYFPYVWNGTEWVGNKESNFEGQRFVYTQSGNDALQADYTWEDGKWLEYFHMEYTYNDADLLILLEKKYWNREKQDWSGGDAYGEWGDIKNNSRQEDFYDEYGRHIRCDVFKCKSGKYVNNWRSLTEYEDLGDGMIQRTETSGSVSNAGQDYAPYAKTIQKFNRFGSEAYYCSYSLNDETQEWMPKEEEIRYFMDGYHWFTGGDYYYYNNGQRMNSSKERFYYADDFNPEDVYETPYEGRHWVSGGKPEDDGWRPKSIDQFTWGPRDVMTGYVGWDCLSGEPVRSSGFEVEYDFSADCSEIFMWPDSNKGQTYYENKTLTDTRYNGQSENGPKGWNETQSYQFVYYYSPRELSYVEDIEAVAEREEVARYDLLGNRLSDPVPGVNIVVYSDGTSVKAMVKQK